jgi:hypothetical protein
LTCGIISQCVSLHWKASQQRHIHERIVESLRHSRIERPLCAYDVNMANKAMPSGQDKKKGKTLLEKRAVKKAKKDAKSKRGTAT